MRQQKLRAYLAPDVLTKQLAVIARDAFTLTTGMGLAGVIFAAPKDEQIGIDGVVALLHKMANTAQIETEASAQELHKLMDERMISAWRQISEAFTRASVEKNRTMLREQGVLEEQLPHLYVAQFQAGMPASSLNGIGKRRINATLAMATTNDEEQSTAEQSSSVPSHVAVKSLVNAAYSETIVMTAPRYNNTRGLSCDKARGLERAAAYMATNKKRDAIVHAIKLYGTSTASDGTPWDIIERSHHFYNGILLEPAAAAIGGVPITALIPTALGGLSIYTVDMDEVKASMSAASKALVAKIQEFLAA